MAHRPVIVVTGFLGGGKTTLIARLLTTPSLRDAAVIVNELGEVALDHDLLRPTTEQAIAIAGGCACCTRREDLVRTLRELLALDERGTRSVKRVVIETSGLADPAPILATIAADPVLCHHYAVDRVVCVVDALDGAEQLDRQPEAIAQAAAADCLVITKSDLLPSGGAGALRERLVELNPSAEVLEAVRGQLDARALLRPRAPGHGVKTPTAVASARHREDGVRTASLELDRPLDWTVFGVWLSMLVHAHGECLLRFKGLLDVGGPGPVALDGVRHVVHPPVHYDSWPDGRRVSRLVFVLDRLEPRIVLHSLEVFHRALASGSADVPPARSARVAGAGGRRQRTSDSALGCSSSTARVASSTQSRRMA